ncbi:nicotinate (nicotinamide) nucleotide adenylyltransferase [candidate division WOR-1 bacterium RIFCSPHIGHO2_02_FULL_45_12]|nr:MAG: nicotinate (nicotinamide) nucleotide adenylyltransferase [candidate division WOR-1 bacterium RIFCSPHIGHO2_02_FULL_45_12]
MKRIGIMGGTFNPIHKGHLALANAALQEFALDKVIFIPSGLPPHKEYGEIIDKEHRYMMVKLAIKGKKKYIISRIEMDRKGVCYAVDTFNKLKRKYKSQCKLFYIMGLDSINEILDWKKPLELFKLCEFIVGTRPGTKIRTFRRLVKFPPLQKEVDKINLMELRENISSSDIRQKIKNGRSVKSIVPKAVEAYILKHNIYDS